MIAATTAVGIDVSRDWLDGFCHPSAQRFCLPNTSEGHKKLCELIERMPSLVKVGFEATGGQEWALWSALAAAGVEAVLKPVAKHLKERGKPRKLVIVAIAHRLVTLANAALKTASPWRTYQDA